MDTDKRLNAVIAAIDSANVCDPRRTEVDGHSHPSELVYGRRMTETLGRLVENPSIHLRIAARGQHIERWKIPRLEYPQGRAGYLAWRRDQRAYQARRLGEIMRGAGYGSDDIARVGVLIRKERMDSDPEVQLFEDVICIMFLEHYLPDFMSRVSDDKLSDILAKTWKRMSDFGRANAAKLPLPPAVLPLLEQGLSRLNAA